MHYTPSTIPPEAVAAIAPAFDRYGMHESSEWVQRCRDDLAQLWRVGQCWAITEAYDCKQGKVCHIAALAGEFTHEIMQSIEAWAASIGCTKVLFTGRKGWAKRLPDYTQTAIVMAKEIP